jgi:hypothetical protein
MVPVFLYQSHLSLLGTNNRSHFSRTHRMATPAMQAPVTRGFPRQPDSVAGVSDCRSLGIGKSSAHNLPCRTPVTLVEVAAQPIKSQQLRHSYLQSDRHVGSNTIIEPAASMRAALYDNQITVHLDINERAQTVAPEPRHASRRAAGLSGD